MEDDVTQTGALTDEEILKITCIIYGSMFAAVFLLFCCVRRKFPRVYNVRGWLPKLQCDLAKDQFGFISWTWKLFQIPEAEFLDQCGMDAVCLVRAQIIGLKLSLFGIFLSVWLLPVYATAPQTADTADITDRVQMLTVANVPAGSRRLLATLIASYLLFGFTMYLILQEFKWFIGTRTKWLTKKEPRNFTVFVTEITPKLRSDAALGDYFRRIFSEDAVLEVNVALSLPKLSQKVENRRILVENLEHALNIQQILGVTPTHCLDILGATVNSIDAYQRELQELNKEICDAITELEKKQGRRLNDENFQLSRDERRLEQSTDLLQSAVAGDQNDDDLQRETTHTALIGASQEVLNKAIGASQEVLNKAIGASQEVLNKTKNIIGIANAGGDGEPLSAGFVTFAKLSAVMTSKQMLHSNIPFQMEVVDAPTPQGIVWSNVGRPLESIHTGHLLSLIITVLLCLFWTIPVSFLLSLTEVDSLKEELPFLEDWISKAPWIEKLLQQIAPILLWILREILYVILDVVVMMEGHVGASALEASLFLKLAAFDIIQNFFVASVAGTLTGSVSEEFDDLKAVVNFLATTLPPKSTFFIQFIVISTVVGLTFELLRITQVWQERIRRRVGNNLTEKERNKRWKFLRPLGDPRNFFHARIFSGDTVLPFLICFVYSTLAPITCYFLAFCFLVQSVAFKHLFIYIYPTTPDSGGMIFMSSVNVLLICMITAEVILCGYLMLKEAPVTAPLMIPLIVITFLFACYLRQRHFHVARFLSAENCLYYDEKYMEEGVDFEFVQGKYLHPALKDKEILPDNLPYRLSSNEQQDVTDQKMTDDGAKDD